MTVAVQVAAYSSHPFLWRKLGLSSSWWGRERVGIGNTCG